MDDKDFKLKTLEHHLSQASGKYTKCVANAVKDFLETKTDFDILSKDCQQYKEVIDDLMIKYKMANQTNE
jgi:hypothetical protein